MIPYKLLQESFSLGNFLNSIQLGILFINENYVIESPNKASSTISGFSQKELIDIPFTQLLSEKSRKFFLEKFKVIVDHKTNIDSEVFELEIINERKEKIPIELNINSTLTVSDQLYILIINDISERIKLQREVKEQIENIEEVEDELEKVQELSELKSRFVTMASHEFRTPLAGVLSSVNLVSRYLDAEEKNGIEFTHKVKIQTHFDKIRESVGNLTQILNEFLSLGKLEEGKVSCNWEEVDLNELGNYLTEDLQKLCKKDQHIIPFILLSKNIYLLDHNMIRNILNNLISNAIKYSGAGSKIEVSITDTKRTLLVKVKDEGLGIPQEDQGKLFSRFFRAKNAINIQGTGLGLNIVKRYVEMMGGSISFESELNKGTTFTVLIPIRDEI